MLLKSLKLHNIRSHESTQINFPSGSTLLSGDIGSGKSTILLAIEFALFGIKRPELTGPLLLRHGKKEGIVELMFEMQNKNIIIQRKLKRSKEDVGQESGFIVVDGMKKEAAPTELKSEVYEILGYPKELVGKSKDLLFRYTVYTPQEQMKSIIFEDKDTRLDILRRVFNIDKYKRIRSNVQIVEKQIREALKEKSGMIADIEDKKKALEQAKNELKGKQELFEKLLPELNSMKTFLNDRKNEIQVLENDIKQFHTLKTELIKNEALLKNTEQHLKRDNDKIKLLEPETEQIKKSVEKFGKEIDLTAVKQALNEKEKTLRDKEVLIRQLIGKQHLIDGNIKNASQIKEKILQLSKCPTCQQDVTIVHKHFVSDHYQKEIDKLSKELEQIQKDNERYEGEISSMKDEITQLRAKETDLKIVQVKIEAMKSKELELNIVKENIERQKLDIEKLHEKMGELQIKVEKNKDIEAEYEKSRKEIEEITKKERKLEIEHATLKAEIKNFEFFIKKTNDEIVEKEKIREKILQLNNWKIWLDDFFINLMAIMEKHVMMQVQQQFNELFQNWFRMLIEDEAISVRIDDEFTPMVVQDGYETSIEGLSGGEKTSVALSYRLALNKVINDIISEIKTKNLIILDEPTDGFSSEQLDRVREVLQQLNVKQTLIVSHESKIESFVDHVVRVGKMEGVSVIS